MVAVKEQPYRPTLILNGILVTTLLAIAGWIAANVAENTEQNAINSVEIANLKEADQELKEADRELWRAIERLRNQ